MELRAPKNSFFPAGISLANLAVASLVNKLLAQIAQHAIFSKSFRTSVGWWFSSQSDTSWQPTGDPSTGARRLTRRCPM